MLVKTQYCIHSYYGIFVDRYIVVWYSNCLINCQRSPYRMRLTKRPWFRSCNSPRPAMMDKARVTAMA